MFPVVAEQPVAVSVKVKVATPDVIPVTTPALEIVATAGLFATQFPPDVGDRLIVEPGQTEVGPDKTGPAFTVTVVVTEVVQPLPLVTEYLIVAVPPATPVTNPVVVFTVAINGVKDVHVPPGVESDSCTVVPGQIGTEPVIGFTAGFEYKVKDPLAVPPGVVIETAPLVNPAEGVAVICVLLTLVNEAAGTPLNETAVVPLRFVPFMVTRGVVPWQYPVGEKLVMVGVRTSV